MMTFLPSDSAVESWTLTVTVPTVLLLLIAAYADGIIAWTCEHMLLGRWIITCHHSTVFVCVCLFSQVGLCLCLVWVRKEMWQKIKEKLWKTIWFTPVNIGCISSDRINVKVSQVCFHVSNLFFNHTFILIVVHFMSQALFYSVLFYYLYCNHKEAW